MYLANVIENVFRDEEIRIANIIESYKPVWFKVGARYLEAVNDTNMRMEATLFNYQTLQ